MKGSAITILWLGLGILLLSLGCAAPQVETKETGSHISKIFAREYDEVWKALEMVMVEELMYPVKVKDKKNGIIETDWISIIRIRGTMRWNVRVLVSRKGGSTVVKIYNRVEEPTEVRGKMKDKRGDVKSGWEASEEKVAGGESIFELLDDKLTGNQAEESFSKE